MIHSGGRREEPRAFLLPNLDLAHVFSYHISSRTAMMELPLLQRLAVPGVSIIIAFLAYPSQLLFAYIEPGPLRKGDAYLFNLLVACIFICYYRTCFTAPGKIPRDWQSLVVGDVTVSDDDQAPQRQRWCRKCEAYKPPRAHHCKTCKQSV